MAGPVDLDGSLVGRARDGGAQRICIALLWLVGLWSPLYCGLGPANLEQRSWTANWHEMQTSRPWSKCGPSGGRANFQTKPVGAVSSCNGDRVARFELAASSACRVGPPIEWGE